MKILMNVAQGHIFAIRMQFVAIRWGVTVVTAKKMETGMATDSTVTITIHVGIGQVSMDYKVDPPAHESMTLKRSMGPLKVLAPNTQYAKLILLPMIKQLAHAYLLFQVSTGFFVRSSV